MDAVILTECALKVNPSLSLLAWSEAGDDRLVEIFEAFFMSISIASFAQQQELRFLLSREDQFLEYRSITDLSTKKPCSLSHCAILKCQLVSKAIRLYSI